MKSHRSLLNSMLLIACAICISLPANALSQPRGMQMPDSTQISAMFDSLAMKVTLADSQKAKAREIYFASFAETRKMMEKGGSDFRAVIQERRKIAEKRDNDIKALLSDEQKKAYDKYIEEERAKMRSRMGGRRPGN